MNNVIHICLAVFIFKLSQRKYLKGIAEKAVANHNFWGNETLMASTHHPKAANDKDNFPTTSWQKWIIQVWKRKVKTKSWERKREQWQNSKVTMQTEEFKEILFKLLSHKFLLHSLIIARLKNTGLFDIIKNINILKSLYWALSNSLCLATVCIGQFSCNINH